MKSGPMLFVTTPAFAVEAGEDAETQPGRYGRAFARWLAERFAERGHAAGAPIAEDFGWCVPLEGEAFPLYVACANEEDTTDTWAAFVFAEPPFWKSLLRRVDTGPAVTRATATLRDLMAQAPGATRTWEEK